MFKLLIVAVLAVLALLAVPSEAVFSNKLMLLVRPKLLQCAKDNNVSDEDLKAIIANDLTNQSKAIQCTSLCFFKQLGQFNQDNTINVLATKALFSLGERPWFVNTVVNKCKDFKGDDDCHTASLVYKCYVENQLL